MPRNIWNRIERLRDIDFSAGQEKDDEENTVPANAGP
jgi:hypothetical protein